MPLVWLAVALAFALGEVLTLAFYAIFVVVAAVAAAVAASLGLNFGGQVTVFALVSILGVVAARPTLMRYIRARSAPVVKSGADSMIGQQAPVVDDILDPHRPGHVSIAGESWPALSEDGSPIRKGSTIRVTGLKQATLLVALVEAAREA